MEVNSLRSAAVDKAWLLQWLPSPSVWGTPRSTPASRASRPVTSSSEGSEERFELETNANTASAYVGNKRIRAINAVLHDYSLTSTIHGIGLIGKNNMNPFERAFWVVAVAVCGALMCHLTYGQWRLYIDRPSKVRIVTNDYDTQLVHFPGITICPNFVLKPSKAYELLQSIIQKNYSNAPGNRSSSPDYHVMALISKLDTFGFGSNNFIESVTANFSATVIPYLNDVIVISELMKQTRFNCEDLLLHCAWKGMTFDCCEFFSEQNTSRGYCLSFNSKTSSKPKRCAELQCHVSSSGIGSGLEIVLKRFPKQTFSLISKFKNYMKATYYLPSSQFNTRPKSPREVIDAEQVFLNFHKWETANRIGVLIHDRKARPEMSRGFTISTSSPVAYAMSISLVVTKATPQLRDVDVKDRRCFFPGEIALLTSSYYTQYDCIYDCYLANVFDHCGCRPYFAHLRPGSPYDHIPECKLSQIECFRKLLSPFYTIMESEKKDDQELKIPWPNCTFCLPACDTKDFTGRTRRIPAHLQSHEDGSERGPSIDISYDQFRSVVMFQRSPAIPSTDLLVTIGGLVSLCLGCSFLSGLDVVHMAARVLMSAIGFELKPIYSHHHQVDNPPPPPPTQINATSVCNHWTPQKDAMTTHM